MLKLNKSIHFNILCIFAIVFVCVYLYYTITDVKKIAVEVKKHGQDIPNIVTSLATITKELGELKKKAAACSVGGVCQVKPVITAQEVVEQEEPESEPDDDDSVATEDVKHLLSDIPDDEGNDDTAPDVLEEEFLEETSAKDYKSMSAEELKHEKYDDLKEYCKNNNINAKGTKDVLIQRIRA
jgi:hypothetical protein